MWRAVVERESGESESSPRLAIVHDCFSLYDACTGPLHQSGTWVAWEETSGGAASDPSRSEGLGCSEGFFIARGWVVELGWVVSALFP